MGGAGVLELRSFSGFDFARLLRNFEITADSPSAAGQVRLTALAFYLAPALAVNGAVLQLAATFWVSLRRWGAAALILSGVYSILLIGVLLILSVVPVNDFADVVGPPRYGLALSAASAMALAGLGLRELRPR